MQETLERKPVKMTTVQMRSDLHQAVKTAADEDYMNITRWIERAVREALERRQQQARRR